MTIKNPRGHDLQCSLWEKEETHAWLSSNKHPCIIYLHGNSSSRISALEVLPVILPLGASLFAFDFSGCGNSGGDYVSLGWHERDDLQACINFLRASNKASSIALWGRSMGAATALMHSGRDASLSAMILDSPFASLPQLMRELSGRMLGPAVPSPLVEGLLGMVQSSIQERAEFNIMDVEPIAHAKTSRIPALFATGDADKFIEPHHCKQLHDAYVGEKSLITFAGDHHSIRPPWFNHAVSIFLQKTLMSTTEQPTNPDGTKVARASPAITVTTDYKGNKGAPEAAPAPLNEERLCAGVSQRNCSLSLNSGGFSCFGPR